MSDNQTRRIIQLEDENFLLKMRIEELQERINMMEKLNGTIEH